MIRSLRKNVYALFAIAAVLGLSIAGLLGQITKAKYYFMPEVFGKRFTSINQADTDLKNKDLLKVNEYKNDAFYIKINNDSEKIYVTEKEAQAAAFETLQLSNGYASGYSNSTPSDTGITNNSFYREVSTIYPKADGSAINSLTDAENTYITSANRWTTGNYTGPVATNYYTSKANALAAYYTANGIVATNRNEFSINKEGITQTSVISTADITTKWKDAYKASEKANSVIDVVYTAVHWENNLFTDGDYTARRDTWIANNSTPAGVMVGDANYANAAALDTAATAAVAAITCNGNVVDNKAELDTLKTNINGKITLTNEPTITCTTTGTPDNLTALQAYWNTLGTQNNTLWAAAFTPVENDYRLSPAYETDLKIWEALPAQTARRTYRSVNYNTVALANAAVDAYVNGLNIAADIITTDRWYENTGFTGTSYASKAALDTAVENRAQPSSKEVFWANADNTVIYQTRADVLATITIASKVVSKDAYDAGLASFAAGIEAKTAFKYTFEGQDLLFDTDDNLKTHLYKSIGVDGITKKETTLRYYTINGMDSSKLPILAATTEEEAYDKWVDYWRNLFGKLV